MEFQSYKLREELAITKLYSFHYFELEASFIASQERHDFWEMVYVDKGEIEIVTDCGRRHLKQGDMIFYPPNVVHEGRACNGSAPVLLILSFECHAACMSHFNNVTLQLDDREREMLSELLEEGLACFDPAVDSRDTVNLASRTPSPFGSEQLVKITLEALLIRLIRNGRQERKGRTAATLAAKQNRDKDIVESILAYMERHIASDLSHALLCREFAIGRSQLTAIFYERTGFGVMEYFSRMKVKTAQTLIREEKYNFTEIAGRLGYSSVHYFSRSFKRKTGMTPTEYARSVKARLRQQR
ncbi:AraC family transcriptional regulator [Paenibacillus sp. J5C_2022]|uniref:AraC family transcriptional regulator n=1 Tax=Paenibacillus sp. J5C2022 TaxID=2977129 RepID=UPI0021D15F04|nr:AraC family transcriptional regulator [Paenibacillus sp. J5C2022]MCU6707488.1 AraC family transcriptional regulator [Paenibacillus sp. J5C2022]